MILKNIAKQILKKMGCTLQKIPSSPFEPAMEQEFKELIARCDGCHMQSIERLYALFKAVQYVVEHRIPGDIVECGVFRGTSPMLAAYTLLKMNEMKRSIYLYDTFEGMTAAGEKDIDLASGRPAEHILYHLGYQKWNEWGNTSLDEVKKNVWTTGYPKEKFIFVKGPVEETLPRVMPERISILRLDTDWYESTYHELVHLFPKLSTHGVIIIDDYGHWQGAKEATDKYFSENGIKIFLNRIDYTGRIGIKV